MKCQKCKKAIRADSRFCRFCGNDISDQLKKLERGSKFVDSLSAYSKKGGGFLPPSHFRFHIANFISFKTVVAILIILGLSAGVSLAAPKIQDYMDVSKTLDEAKTLADDGNYSQALGQLDNASGKWTLDSKREEVEKLRDNLRSSINNKETWNEALNREQDGNLEEAVSLLSEIDSSYENYNKVEEKISTLSQKIEEENQGTFSDNQDVLTTGILRVRENPSTSAAEVVLQSNGARGTVVDGPEESDGYIWWEIEYENGYTGWSAEEFLTEAPGESTKFQEGDGVRTSVTLSVREDPAAGAALVDKVPSGTTGEILGGPERADGYWWWRVGYNNSNGSVGWSVENYLSHSSQSSYNPEPEEPSPSTKFNPPVEVETTANLSVREEPGGNKIGTQSLGSKALVLSGPEYENGSHWWKLKPLDGSPTGWSAEDWLKEYTGSTSNNSDNSNNSSQLPNLANLLDEDYDNFQDAAKSMYAIISDYTDDLEAVVKEIQNTGNFDLIDTDDVLGQIHDPSSDNTARDLVKSLEDYPNSNASVQPLLQSIYSLRDVVQTVEEAESSGNDVLLKRALSSNSDGIIGVRDKLETAANFIDL